MSKLAFRQGWGAIALGCLLAATGPRASAQGECGAAQDLVVQAREHITPQATNSDIEDGLELLKHANSLCSELGDAWYYRSLFEKKLGHDRLADYALRQARSLGSEALAQGLDPFALAAPSRPGEAPSGPVREKWALVVGIGQFRDPYIRAQRSMRADATSLASVLTDKRCGRFQPDHVKLLTDSTATKVGILTSLNWIARSAGPDDLVVIYVATHGSAREMDHAGVNYLMTYDTDLSGREDTLYATALAMEDVTEAVRTRIRARRTAVFLDTCHSGGALGRNPPVPGLDAYAPSTANLDAMRPGVGRAIITSSAVDQKSYESPKLGHGYFTYCLMQALRRDQGLDPIGKIFAYLEQEVPRQARLDGWGPETPVLSESPQGGEIVIGVASATARLARPGPLLAWGGF